jgi:predicted Zn-dependent peptidase
VASSRAKVTTLDNGLRVVTAPLPQLHRAHVALYVRVGSRFEEQKTSGISHFLEHMLYRGTDRLPSAHDVNLAFEQHGGYLYAATQVDYGVFSLTLPPESLAATCELFADVLLRPRFFDIAIEKGIVLEELREDLDDDGRQIDPDNLSRMLIYPTHPLGFTITGSAETVQSFDVPLLASHHARHYTAASSVLAFSGAIDEDRAIELARTAFGGMPAGAKVVSAPPAHAQKKPRVRIVDNHASQTDLRIAFRAFAENTEQRAALDMLMRVIDDGMSTRLYHRICDSQGLCYDVTCGYDGYEDDGVVDFAAGVAHERAAKVTGEILALMGELADEGPTEDELAKARRRASWEVAQLADSAEELAGAHAHALLFGRDETPEERLAKTLRVTQDEVREVARTIAQPDRLNVLAVGVLDRGEDKRLVDVVKKWKASATSAHD